MPFQPVVDGEVIPAAPMERISAGASAQVDLIAGTNTDDWRLFRVISGEIDQITDQVLTGPVGVYGYLALAAYGLPAGPALAAYRARYPSASPGDLLAAVTTDWWMRIPAIRLADARARAPAAPTCTSSPGPHRRSAGAWAPATGWRSPSSSTP
jgi:carboxylesterase type B